MVCSIEIESPGRIISLLTLAFLVIVFRDTLTIDFKLPLPALFDPTFLLFTLPGVLFLDFLLTFDVFVTIMLRFLDPALELGFVFKVDKRRLLDFVVP